MNGLKQKKQGKLLALLLAILLTFTGVQASAAGMLSALRINQTTESDDGITLYFDALDEEGKAIGNLKNENLSLMIGNDKVETSLQNFASSGEGLAAVFAIDVSRSLSDEQFSMLKSAIASYINGMSQKDVVALVSFGETVNILCDYTGDRSALLSSLEALSPVDKHTKLNEGIGKSLDLARRQDEQLPLRRVVIVLSDGVNSASGGLTSSEIKSKMEELHVPVYALGFQHAQDKSSKYINNLGAMARSSGGELFLIQNQDEILSGYQAVRERIQGAYVLSAPLTAEMGSGLKRGVSLTANLDGRVMEDSMDVRLFGKQSAANRDDPVQTAAAMELNTSPTATLLTPKKRGSAFSFLKLDLLSITIIALLALILAACLVYLILRLKKKRAGANAGAGEALPKGSKQRPLEQDDSTMALFGETMALGIDQTVALDQVQALTVQLKNLEDNKEYSLRVLGTVTIGRMPERNALAIPDKTVSACHCELCSDYAGLHVRDLGSQNGTFVNGERVLDSLPLKNGDILKLGLSKFRISISG